MEVSPADRYGAGHFALLEGDGDLAIVGQRLLVDRIFADWFPDHIDGLGPTWLVRVVGGEIGGLLLVLAKGEGRPSIQERFSMNRDSDAHGEWPKIANTVNVYKLLRSNADSKPKIEDLLQVGKSAIVELDNH
jgi:hypothetical protein